MHTKRICLPAALPMMFIPEPSALARQLPYRWSELAARCHESWGSLWRQAAPQWHIARGVGWWGLASRLAGL